MAIEGTEQQLAFGFALGGFCLTAEFISAAVRTGRMTKADAVALYGTARKSLQALKEMVPGDPAIVEIAVSLLTLFEQRIAMHSAEATPGKTH